jgi:DNA-binding MarR family transcriptional regulator
MISSEKELELLEAIYTREEVHQRDLANVLGISLGMTNSILKRLVKKGLLTIQKVNNRNIMYAVSPDGIDAIARRSYRYFKRTIKNVVYYRQKIEDIIGTARAAGHREVVLIGASDLDFIVEHACYKHSLHFSTAGSFDPRDGVFYIFSEKYKDEQKDHSAAPHAGPSTEGRTVLDPPREEPAAGDSGTADGGRNGRAYLREVLTQG